MKIEDLCELVVDCPHSTPEWTESGILVFRNWNIRNGRMDLSKKSFTTKKDYNKRIKRAKPQPGDIIVTREAPMGEAAIIPEEVWGCLGQRLVLLRPNMQLVDQRYLLYSWMSPYVQQQILVHDGTGSTVSNLRIPILKQLDIPTPSLNEQKAIASILGSLDDKIELNNKMNQTLETMARALYKLWFVDFDPVVAKAAGKRPFGMDDETAALFPHTFVDSELGPIPKEWEVSTIGEQCKVVGGGTPSTKNEEYWVNGNINWATPKDLSGLKDPIILNTNRMITRKGLDKINSGLLPSGTVLLSSRAPVGYTAIAEIPLAINQGFIAIPESNLLSKYFIYFWLYENIDEILQRSGGTTFAEISKRNFRPIPIIVPSASLMEVFTQNCSEYFTLINNNIKESQTLSQLRDLLLPKLISGEIRIKDAEKVVEEVL